MCTSKPGAYCTAEDPTPGRIGTTRAKSFVKLILLAHFLGQIAHVQGKVAHFQGQILLKIKLSGSALEIDFGARDRINSKHLGIEELKK